LVTGKSVIVAVSEAVPVAVEVVLPMGRSVDVDGRSVMTGPEELVEVTGMSVEVALGIVPGAEVVLVESPMGINEVRGGRRPEEVSEGNEVVVVEFCVSAGSDELVVLVSGPGRRLLSNVLMGSKMPPLLLVVASVSVLLPTGVEMVVVPVGSLELDDTMPVGPMTIPDSV
jgi:hypothetical protein